MRKQTNITKTVPRSVTFGLLFFITLGIMESLNAQNGEHFPNYDNDNWGFAAKDALQVDYNSDNDGKLRGHDDNADGGGLVFGGKGSGEGISSNRRASGGFGPQYGLNFITNSNINMVIDNTGEVGIGTDNPQEQFQIGDRWTFHDGGSKVIGYNFKYSSGNKRILNDKAAVIQFTSDGGITFNTAPYGSAGSPIYFIPGLRINNNGNIGMGVTNPLAKLHVDGKIRLDGTSSTYLSVFEKNTSSESRFWTHTDGELYIQNSEGINFGGINDSSRYMSILDNGNVGIGTAAPQSKLAVNGKVTAKEVEVTSEGWADFVFASDYKLDDLLDIEAYIDTHKHLPNIPSEKEVIKNGLQIGEMLKLQMQKIEELTLYTIAHKKHQITLEKRIQILEKENKKLKQTCHEN